jgi:lipoprotein-releasing system permease protein
MLTSFKIASRFLRKSKIQTLIIIMGIAIGVSVQIFIGLLSQGLDKSLLSKVAGSFVHINITSSKGSIESWEDIERKIKAVDKNINIVSPVIEHNAFINTNNKKQNIQVRGFLPQDLNTLYDMKNKIYEGKMISKSGQALIGKDLGDKLGLKIGDKINVVNFQGKNVEVIVVGFYNLGAVKLNSIWVITDLKTAQDIADSGNKITSFELSTNDAYNADNIANNIKNSIKNNDLKIENWKDQNKLIASAIIGQKICSVIIQISVLLASVLSIMSILNISVVQKYKEIGILKAMGIKDGSAAVIFLLQAFILGLIGTAVGVLLTMLYIKGFNRYIVTSDGKPIVDIIINNRFIIISSLIAVAASTLAAVFPAIKSLKLTPVEVIKNG